MTKKLVSIVLGFGLLICATIQPAKAVTFSYLSGDYSASAAFTNVGGNLQVVLTNTSGVDTLVPGQVLTAVFFDIVGVGALTPTSAILSAGSTVFYDPDGQPAGGNVGGEWAYASGLVGAPAGATEGISSAGFGLFGATNFGGPNLAGPATVGGLQYGILTAGDNSLTGNGGITGSGGLIRNSVTFVLGGLPTGFVPDFGNVNHVAFQYGTSLNEVTLVPEPEIYAMMLAGLGLMGFVARRRKQQAAA